MSTPPPPHPSNIPPPPRDSSFTPTQNGAHAGVPAGELLGDEVHEDDVLRRKNHFSWKKFGGDGFLFSVVFHVILAVLAIFWIVSQLPVKNSGDPEQTVFDTGEGGGRKGDVPAEIMATAPVSPQVKTLPRLVSNAASPISLPEATATPMALSGSLSLSGVSGALSAGDGGGGGIGKGIGIGKGAENFVAGSPFGRIGTRRPALSGYIYDFTQTREGTPNANNARYSGGNNLGWLTPLVTKFIQTEWKLHTLDDYFRGPAEVGVHQILIPRSAASAAPEAFQAKGKMRGGAWIAVYRAQVRSPENGRIRFSGNADNYLALRFDRKNVLLFGCGKTPSETVQSLNLRMPTANGKWITVNKGDWYEMEVLIGDGGGLFSAMLYYERKDDEGKFILFRTEDIDWKELLATDTGDLPSDLDPKSPVWDCKPFPGSKTPR